MQRPTDIMHTLTHTYNLIQQHLMPHQYPERLAE